MLLVKQEGAIVARMSAVEEMAGMDILCSDKTGTLTLNELSVDKPNVIVVPKGMPLDEACPPSSLSPIVISPLDIILLGAPAHCHTADIAMQKCYVSIFGVSQGALSRC